MVCARSCDLSEQAASLQASSPACRTPRIRCTVVRTSASLRGMVAGDPSTCRAMRTIGTNHHVIPFIFRVHFHILTEPFNTNSIQGFGTSSLPNLAPLGTNKPSRLTIRESSHPSGVVPITETPYHQHSRGIHTRGNEIMFLQRAHFLQAIRPLCTRMHTGKARALLLQRGIRQIAVAQHRNERFWVVFISVTCKRRVCTEYTETRGVKIQR